MDISVNLFGDYNENNQNIEMGSNWKNESCEEPSKIVFSRNKMLRERNESSEELNCGKRSDFGPKPIVSKSSSKPYDPLTNYLSPRPKFLRYNPDRPPRRTSLSPPGIESTETENGNEIEDNVDEQELEKDETEASEDEFDESEDEFVEKSWDSKWVLKALIVLAALFLSTDHISNMNSPTQPLSKNEVCLVQNPLVDVVILKCFEDRNVEFVVDNLDEREVGTLLDFNEEKLSDEFDENMGLTQGGETEDVSYHNIDEPEVGFLNLNKRINDVFDENMGLTLAGEIEDGCDHEMDVELEAQEKVEALVDHVKSEINVVNGELRGEMEETFTEGYEESSDTNDEVVTLETISIEESKPKLTIIWVAQQIRTYSRHMTSKSITVGICAICSFVALLVLGFHYKFTRTPADVQVLEHQEHSEKISNSTLRQPCSARAKAEKNLVIEATKSHESCHGKIESVTTPCTLIYPMEEEQASKGEYYETRAPTVALLGEFDVGEVSCSSIKSCQEKSNRMMESDLSNYSISREEIVSWSNPRRQIATPKQSSTEVSLTDSPSYGSFTPEGSRQSEEIATPVRKIITTSARKVMTTTPVRRSSRLQNRPTLSP